MRLKFITRVYTSPFSQAKSGCGLTVIHVLLFSCTCIDDSDDDSEYYSATDHSNDSESTGSSVHVTEWSLDSQNSQLMLSIRRRDSEGVLEAMDESNKWILQQKIWYLDKKVC